MMNIAAQIPPCAKRVAELGCLREKAGAAFLRIQPKAEYWGITCDREELKEAGTFLTHALYALPEELDFGKLGIYEVDVLILRGQYLRGLTAERLKKWTEVLSEDGQLLLETPNPACLSHYLEILAGKRVSPEYGGMSMSHARQLLEEAGLYVLPIQGSYDQALLEIRNSKESAALGGALGSILQKLGWQAAGGTDLWLGNYLFKALKKPLDQENKILMQTAIGESIVTAKVRVHDPASFLSTVPGLETFSFMRGQKTGPKMPEGMEQKIIIRQRLTYHDTDQAMTTIENMRKVGYLIVAEMDDNPQTFMEKERDNEQLLSYIGTHAIQVSTKPLAEIMRQYNPHVQVFPNQLRELPDRRHYIAERLQRLKEGVDYVNFFFGALNRTHEWQKVMPVICEAIEKYGSRLRFKVLSDRGFFEALPTEHKEFIGSPDMYGGQFVPYNMYIKALHSSDISFLPLRDNAFNRTKSDLKFIESAGHGAVVLASPTVYEATVKDGRNGFIYRNPREFREYLTLLIENRERRIETAEAAYHYVKNERLLANHYLERLAWYKELLKKRPELDREMMQRISDWQKSNLSSGKERG